MTATIIILLCVLLLTAYLFDLTAAKTSIPSVILLFVLGFSVKKGLTYFDFRYPDFDLVLPILGTIGLILIVLEGSLELELNKTKLPLIKKSLIGVLISTVAPAFVVAALLSWLGGSSYKDALICAIPFCVISSAIAIPSVRHMGKANREFIVFESSLSDIVGVIFFNFILLNAVISIGSFGIFMLQILAMIVISFVATLGLSYLLSKIEHHIKFVPIMLMVILVYEVSKEMHLPSLLFILIFGLIMGNIDELKNNRFIKRLNPEGLNEEVKGFKSIIIEFTFLVRALFFLLFGFLINANEVLNTDTLLLSVEILLIVYTFRAIQLIVTKMPLRSLLFISPRGLITILLFISIKPENLVPFINKSVVVQVVLLSVIVMMIGQVVNKKSVKEKLAEEKNEGRLEVS